MHLFVDISSHGFGHLAQTAPVLNALREKLPQLRLTIRCGLPRERIARRINGEFEHIPTASDFGMAMKSALEIDREASLAAYREFHADWEQRLETDARLMRGIGPDLVFSNVSYLALAAAQRAGIPAIALSSLDWAHIAAPYFSDVAEFAPMRAQMLDAYRSAIAFLRITPGMPMPDFEHVVDVGPVALPGQNVREALHASFDLSIQTRIALVVMGGIYTRLSSQSWPAIPGVIWLAQRDSGLDRKDVRHLEDTDLKVSDLIASCDCVVTKSGYGTFVEAAASGTPMLFVSRPDWPEEAALAEWHARVSRSIAISREELAQGTFGSAVEQLLNGPRPAPVKLSGVHEAVDFIAARLPSPAGGRGAGGEGKMFTAAKKNP